MVSVKALAVMVSSPFIRLHKSSIPQSRRVTELFIDDEERTLAKASIWRSNDPIVNNIAVLRVKGTHYEMGFQHGRLLETEVNSFYNSMLKLAIAYVGREGLYEAYHIMEPFIPSCYKEEMLGLAQGANLPLSSVHFAHVVPALTEYYHRTQFARGLFYRRPEQRDFVSQTCSFVTAWGDATVNGNMISLRNLDWLRFLNVQKTPTVTVYEYADGTSVANFGFAGFIGSITGMNNQGLTFAEMGVTDDPRETLKGIPFIFLAREMLRTGKTLNDVVSMAREAPRTCSYGYLLGSAHEKNAVMMISNPEEFEVYNPGEDIKGLSYGQSAFFPGIKNVVYAGMFDKQLNTSISRAWSNIDVSRMQQIAHECATTSCVQSAIMCPDKDPHVFGTAYVANAKGLFLAKGQATNRPYFGINLDKVLANDENIRIN